MADDDPPPAPEARPDVSLGALPDTPPDAAAGASPGAPTPADGVPPTRPSSGPGTPARFGRRLAALVLDCVLSALVAAFFTRPEAPRLWSALVFFVASTFFLGVFGQTPGMRLFRIACVRADGAAVPVGIPRAALRAALLQLFVPAVFLDREGRGGHDRAAGTIVINV